MTKEIKRPSRTEHEEALNMLEWFERYADNHPQQDLEPDEINDLSTAIDTALLIIPAGNMGRSRAETLAELVGRREELVDPGKPVAAVNFEAVARLAGPVIAVLKARLSSGNYPYDQHRRQGVTAPVQVPPRRNRPPSG